MKKCISCGSSCTGKHTIEGLPICHVCAKQIVTEAKQGYIHKVCKKCNNISKFETSIEWWTERKYEFSEYDDQRYNEDGYDYDMPTATKDEILNMLQCDECGTHFKVCPLCFENSKDGICENCKEKISKLTICAGCGNAISEQESSVYTIDGKVYHRGHIPGDYTGKCRGGKYRSIVKEGSPIFSENNTFDIVKSKRTYGLELETEAITEDKDTLWCSKTDGSVCGKEFTSPIFIGDNGIKDIYRFLTDTKGLCGGGSGFHLHIGTQDYTPITLLKLIRIHHTLEEYFYELVSGTRYFNTYCHNIRDYFKDYRIKTLKDNLGHMFSYHKHSPELNKPIRFIKNIRTNQHFLGRTNFNYCNSLFGNRRTMEVRLHHGTWDFKEILNWIILHTSIVDYAKDNSNGVIKKRLEQIKDRKDFLLFIKELCGDDVASHFAGQMIKYWGIKKEVLDYGRSSSNTRTVIGREQEYSQLAV